MRENQSRKNQGETLARAIMERYFAICYRGSFQALNLNSLPYLWMINTLMELQIVYFTFHPFFKQEWEYPSISEKITSVLGFFNFSHYILYSENITLIRVAVIITESIVLVRAIYTVFLLTRNVNTRSKKEESVVYNMLGYIHLIFGLILFVPTIHILSSPFACTATMVGEYVSIYGKDITCIYSKGSGISDYITLLALLSFIIMVIFQERFNYSRRIKLNSTCLKYDKVIS